MPFSTHRYTLAIIAALLHDVVDDTQVELGAIQVGARLHACMALL